MDHPFRLRPSDSFHVGATKVSLYRVKSDTRVSLRISRDGATQAVELAVDVPHALEAGVTLMLTDNTSRSSSSAEVVVSAPDGVAVTSPE